MSVGADLFRAEHSRLLGIGYRLTGVWADAEEVAAEAYERLLVADEPRSPAAWLTTVVTRLAIDRLRRRQREPYVGPWLPEPIDDALLPDEGAELRETLHLGLLALCEQLSPVERAAFVLREAYALSHREVAEILQVSEVSARQHASRARRRLQAEQISLDTRAETEALRALGAALSAGDMAQVATLLTDDVQVWTDGGGKVSSARRVIVGLDKVARFLHGTALGGAVEPILLNGHPGVLASSKGVRRVAWLVLDADGSISRICIVGNPAKLAALPGGR